MSVTANLRLPGISFLPPPRVAGVGLPPLDVAAFVGFAERGPLHTPVPVEDVSSYEAVFGGDLALAREAGGRTVFANLRAAVVAFFANGGRRCYVVRVAGREPTATRLRVPGMVALQENREPRQAAIRAASEGSWSERLRLGARLRTTPLPVSAFRVHGEQELSWEAGAAPGAIGPGDVLRLTFVDGQRLLFPVARVAVTNGAVTGTRRLSATTVGALRGADGGAGGPALPATVRVSRLGADGPDPSVAGSGTLSDRDPTLTLELTGAVAERVRRGDLLELAIPVPAGVERYLFPVMELRAASARTSPGPPPVTATASEMLRLRPGALGMPARVLLRVERLRFDLELREGTERRPALSEMTFNRDHPRFWGDVALLESSSLYHGSPSEPRPASGGTTGRRPGSGRSAAREESPAVTAARLYRKVRSPRRQEPDEDPRLTLAALAGLLAPLDEVEAAATFVPVGMREILDEEDGSGTGDEVLIASPPAVDPDLGTDDLAEFAASRFLDPELAKDRSLSPGSLMGAAADWYYVQDRRLLGIHSLLFVEEVALIAVPDAAHVGWDPGPTAASPRPTIAPPPPPDWSQFQDCAWLPPAPPKTGEPPRPTKQRLPLLRSPETFEDETMLSIQQAVLRVCEARRDTVGILTLPLWFEKRQCTEWQESLRGRLGLPLRRVDVVDTREIADLSYVAVYHPWLLIADEDASDGLRPVPCDGAVCGMIAARERERQVWTAPANVALQGVLGLTPELSTEDWADLADRQINLVRPEPRDFRAMSAHTQSDERALLQLSVRRLMILLRKVAQERGMEYVFRSNDAVFRNSVQAALEVMLRSMFAGGAFAGRTPDESFRVATDASVNPPESLDAGRFIAQIRVAPSQPMEFITVLLTRSGGGLLQATER